VILDGRRYGRVDAKTGTIDLTGLRKRVDLLVDYARPGSSS
jgi:hypothetical protein